MKLITEKNAARKYQQGGPMAAPETAPVDGGAPAPEMQGQGGEDQLMALANELVNMLMQNLGDPNAVMAVLEAAMQMVQEAAGQGQPIFKCGGKLAKKCGGKMAKKK